MKLKNKIALITGASSGIGKETAKLFAKEGVFVILTARHLNKLKLVVNEIKKDNGNAESYELDITDRNQVYEVISRIIKDYGRIDILVNSAGLVVWGSIEDCTYKDFDEQVKLNLTGTFNTIKEVSQYMIKQKSGSIITIITSTVKKTKAGRVAYAASKYGQAGLSNAVHEDLKDKGISVIAIYPTKTDTPIHDQYMGKNDPERKTMMKPEQVAKVILEAALIPAGKDVKELAVNP